MISKTLATLECTAQVTTAPIRMHSTGSPVMAFMKTRAPGACSAGASVSSRICSDSNINPSPIADAADILDPRARSAAEGDEADDEKHRRDGGNVERQHLHDQGGADIGAEHDRKRRHQAHQPFGGKGTGDQRGRGAALEQRRQAEAGGKGGEAVVERLWPAARAGQDRRRAAFRCGPYAGPTAAAPRRPSDREEPWFPCSRAPGIESKGQAIGKSRPINPVVRPECCINQAGIRRLCRQWRAQFRARGHRHS